MMSERPLCRAPLRVPIRREIQPEDCGIDVLPEETRGKMIRDEVTVRCDGFDGHSGSHGAWWMGGRLIWGRGW